MPSAPRKVAACALTLCLALTACSSAPPAPVANSAECISSFDANTDYFPVKTTFEAATGVKVTYHKSYKVVTVNEPVKGASPESYVLLQCGAPKPSLNGDLAKAQVIQVPVKKVATSSTTQLPAFELLDTVEALAGVEAPDMVHGEKLRAAIDAGTIKGFGSESGQISVEKVAALAPDLFMSSGTPEPAYDKIKSLGVPVVGQAEWLENTPLGRAEWIKFTGLFLNEEKTAQGAFASIAKRYAEVKQTAAKAGNRPKVLAGAPYKGKWHRQGGKGYFAAMIADAGGDYVFADAPGTGSTPVELEVALKAGADAPLWLNATTTTKWKSMADLVADDTRLATLSAVKDGAVWNPVLKVRPGGGNDYWQTGTVRPDLVLADLVEIMHPGRLKDHAFTFYTKLPK